jgi:hypothetical protein
MKKATLLVNGHSKNLIFDLSNTSNADNWHYPYWCLRTEFEKHNIELNTADLKDDGNNIFEIHMDVQRRVSGHVPSYVMLYETPQIRALNNNKKFLKKYKRIFTWRDDLVDDEIFIKFNLPNKLIVNTNYGWSNRNKMCCLIAANKTVRNKTKLDLYSERVNTIRWFEKHAPQDFDLYGAGWLSPQAKSGLINHIFRKIRNYFPSSNNKDDQHFPSYRGRVVSKLATLSNYKYNICYENISGMYGYITEKIWDSFFSGCVPIYWGAENILEYIPSECFIDRRNFKSHQELYAYLKSISESRYVLYQENIASFLCSDKSYAFSAKAFAEKIVSTIVSDLEY